MDRAVSLDPEGIYIRLARAGNGLNPPHMFKRLEIVGVTVYKWLTL